MTMNRHAVPSGLGTILLILILSGETSSAVDKVDFEPIIDFLQLPKDMTLGPCSAIDFDSKGRLYLFHRGERPILGFDQNGRFLHSWGDDLIGKAHGLR